MKPISIKVKNVYQYEDFYHEYVPGITGVTGTNGTGKSNFIDPIHYFSWTGKLPPGRNKSEMLRWGETSGYTESTFENNGTRYTLRRNVHNSGVSLTWVDSNGNQEELSKLSEVDAFMEDLFGCTFDVFRENCFVSQGKFLDVIAAPHAERMNYFAKIIGVSKAETLRGILQNNLNRIPTYPSRKADIEDVEFIIQGLRDKLKENENMYKDFSELMAAAEADKVNAEKELSKLNEDEYISNISEAQRKLDEAEKAKADFLKSVSVTEVPEAYPPSDEDREKYSVYVLLPTLEDKHKKAGNKLAELEASAPAEVFKPSRDAADKFKDWLAENKAEYDLYREGKCPTCKRPYEFEKDPEEVITTYEFQSSEYDNLFKAYKLQKEKYDRYEEQMKVHRYALDKATFELKSAESTLNAAKVRVEGFDVDDYLLRKAAYDSYISYLTQLKKHRSRTEELDSEIQKAGTSLQIAVDKEWISDKDAERYKTVMMTYKYLQEQLQETKITIQRTKAEINIHDKQLVKYRDEHAKFRTSGEKRAVLETCRDILHRENLPKIVMRRMLTALNSRMSHFLEQFNTTFTAILSEDFDFICSYSNGQKDKSAKSLSGGQTVALALAFRLALSDIMGASIPILILDEPTVFLDEANIEAVRDVLQSARSYTEKGSYILISTHERELLPAFSDVIDTAERK